MDGMANADNAFDKNAIQFTYDTYMALVDAVVPRTPLLAANYGDIFLYGALDYFTDEYMVMMLNYYRAPLAFPIAQLLNIASMQYLISQGGAVVDANESQRNTAFSMLEPSNRFLVISQLEAYDTYYPDILIIQENPELISAIGSLNCYTMLGYYSEWFGYGDTRLESPNQRVLQFYPPSWEQVGYPGPSLSYINYVNQYNDDVGVK